jgi:hypothetical protein
MSGPGLRADRTVGVQAARLDRSAEVLPDLEADLHEISQRNLRVRRGRVPQDPAVPRGHVDALPDRARRVAARHRHRADEQVRERVEQDVSRTRELQLVVPLPLGLGVGGRSDRVTAWLRCARRFTSPRAAIRPPPRMAERNATEFSSLELCWPEHRAREISDDPGRPARARPGNPRAELTPMPAGRRVGFVARVVRAEGR